ncbi:iron-sulfur cluster assembly scaffold protein [Gammaproteobacteria bacterium]|nr:iron-sulfur cluster assembly scaffold protein [Gammaproteobacteria bacterium]
MINAIYNKDVLRLAADITCIGTLDNSDANASLRSPLCGSSINVSINVKHGRVTAYSQEIKACALGQASASVLAQAVIGKSKNDIQTTRDEIQEMLVNGTLIPKGDWSALIALAPAKDVKSRHGAILLPFDAVLKALSEKEI